MKYSNDTNNVRWYQIHIYSNLTFPPSRAYVLYGSSLSETINYKISYSSIIVRC